MGKTISSLIKSKGGLIPAATRGAKLILRHGIGTAQMKRNIKKYVEILKPYNVKPSFFITASIAMPHIDFIKSIDASWFIHGWEHINYREADIITKEKHIDKIKLLLEIRDENNNLVFHNGFRAPYVAIDKHMLELLEKEDFLFDSSITYMMDVVPGYYKATKAYQTAVELSKSPIPLPFGSNLPFYVKKDLLEIPMTEPSDEMLIDRLGLRNELKSIWIRMMEETIKNNGLFVLQLHPERINIAKKALIALVEFAIVNNVWIPTMDELATWCTIKNPTEIWPGGKKYKACLIVSGDIDRLSVIGGK
jgi:hypothetical protein